MSAFMCSNRHLTVLAAFAVRCCLASIPSKLRFTRSNDGAWMRDLSLDRARANVFAELASENERSVNTLQRPFLPGIAHLMRLHQPSLDSLEDELMELIAIIKLCHCYAYQSNEHPGWETSDARKIIEVIEEYAIRELPGYDAAPWGL